jgi:archaemetzincin
VHEFGHTLGLDHCEHKGCVMSDAKGKALKSADESSGRYCSKCLQTLAPEIRALVRER